MFSVFSAQWYGILRPSRPSVGAQLQLTVRATASLCSTRTQTTISLFLPGGEWVVSTSILETRCQPSETHGCNYFNISNCFFFPSIPTFKMSPSHSFLLMYQSYYSLSILIWLVFFGQWNIASLGAGSPQQEDQAHRVSDGQAEEDCEVYRGMMPFWGPPEFCKMGFARSLIGGTAAVVVVVVLLMLSCLYYHTDFRGWSLHLLRHHQWRHHENQPEDGASEWLWPS